MKKIAIELSELEELFKDPNFDLFDPHSRCESGISDLFNQTQNFPAKETVHITISLPGSSEDLAKQDQIRSAIQRYCAVRISQSEMEIQEIRKQGFRDLRWAVIISVCLLLFAFLITQLTFLPEILHYLLSTSAGIIAWVMLWPPLDRGFYEWSPYRRIKLRYELLKSAQVKLIPQKS